MVSIVRHDMQHEEWCAVARILVKRQLEAGYFPIRLSQLFLEEPVFDTCQSELIFAFLDIISLEDKTIIQAAMSNIDSVDKDELLDILDTHKCRRNVTAENITPILHTGDCSQRANTRSQVYC